MGGEHRCCPWNYDIVVCSCPRCCVFFVSIHVKSRYGLQLLSFCSVGSLRSNHVSATIGGHCPAGLPYDVCCVLIWRLLTAFVSRLPISYAPVRGSQRLPRFFLVMWRLR